MTKEEIALELTKLAAESVINIHRTLNAQNSKPDAAVVDAYNHIYENVKITCKDT